jgi:Na+/H+ antiporter NhaD/arsenite permease-like protein
LNTQQVASVTVFSTLILGALLFWRFRLAFALTGLGILLASGLLTVDKIIEFAGLDIILFLVGMMTVIGYLEERHFFEKLVDRVISLTGQNANRLVIALMLMSALFAALVDEVTSILFMTATVLHITGKYRVNPIPFVIMTIFATNIGSSATVVGNPIGVMIALRGDLTFQDFLRWATPISILALFVMIPIVTRYFSKEIGKLANNMYKTSISIVEEEPTSNVEGVINGESEEKNMRIPWILFLGTIFSLVFHHQVEELLHLEKNSMLLGTAVIAAGITLFLEREKARELVERRVDWWTLTFFLILFASVGTLNFVGVTGILAESLFLASGGDQLGMLVLFTGVASILTALMDNVLAVATFIPIVADIGGLGVNNFPLWWSMLFAGTFFGNLTMIGSTANIVAIGMLERRGRGHISMLEWIKPGALVSIPTLALAIFLIYIQIPFMPS